MIIHQPGYYILSLIIILSLLIIISFLFDNLCSRKDKSITKEINHVILDEIDYDNI